MLESLYYYNTFRYFIIFIFNKGYVYMLLDDENIQNLIFEEITKSDILNIIKKDKDFEKKVKEIAAEVIVNLFKILWQHRNFYDNAITK